MTVIVRSNFFEDIRDQIAEKTGRHLEELHLKFLLGDPLQILEVQTNAVIPLRREPPTPPGPQVTPSSQHAP